MISAANITWHQFAFPKQNSQPDLLCSNVDVWPQSSDSKKKRSFKSFNFNGQYLDGLSPRCKISPFTVYLPVYQGHEWKTSLCKGRTAEPAVEASWFGTGCEGSILNWTHQGGIQNSRWDWNIFCRYYIQFFDGMTFFKRGFWNNTWNTKIRWCHWLLRTYFVIPIQLILWSLSPVGHVRFDRVRLKVFLNWLNFGWL